MPEQTTLDDVWSAWVAGRIEDAVRGCIAIAEGEAQPTAAALLVAALAAADREVAANANEWVDVFIGRGDLPRAVVLAKLADPGALGRVAKAFGKGSKRLADVAPEPPPLPPQSAEIPKALAEKKGDPLFEEALKILREQPKETGAGNPLPRLPLFSALSPPALQQLLAAFEVRDVAAGEEVVREGDEGKEAFVVVRGHVRVIRGDGDEACVLAELGPGAIFGEMALVSDAPRAASVSAREPVQLLAADRRTLEKLSKKTPVIGQQLSQFCRERMVSNLVRHSRILGAVAPHERPALMQRFETRTFKAGEKIVTLGEEPEGLFLLASGNVRVMGRDADGDELVVAELGPGDVVGEMSLVLRRPASADVVATHPTVALELGREPFQEAIREHPTLLGELYDLATKRDEEMKTVVAQETIDVEDVVLL